MLQERENIIIAMCENYTTAKIKTNKQTNTHLKQQMADKSQKNLRPLLYVSIPL